MLFDLSYYDLFFYERFMQFFLQKFMQFNLVTLLLTFFF